MCFACNTYVKNHFYIQHSEGTKDEANDYNSCVRVCKSVFMPIFGVVCRKSHTEQTGVRNDWAFKYIPNVRLFELRSLAVCNMGAFATIHQLIAWRFLIDWISETKMNKSLTCPLHQSSPSMYQLEVNIVNGTFAHQNAQSH